MCTSCPKSSSTYLVPPQLEDEAVDVQWGAAWYVEQSELPSYRRATQAPQAAEAPQIFWSEVGPLGYDMVFGSDREANAS